MSSKTDILIELDPDFYKGKDTFNFPNGDKYEGDYCAHRNGIVWREGIGKYITEDGHSYYGEWRDDKLVEDKPVEINYKGGAQFYGCIVKNKYEGPGTYIFENKIILVCDFNNNKPVGEITLIDIKGREWHGVTALDEALLVPEHIYFNNIQENSGKGRRRYTSTKKKRQSELIERSRSLLVTIKAKTKSISQILPFSQRSRSLVLSRKSMEQEPPNFLAQQKQSLLKEELRIFAKTKKTASDLQFENSDWYKNYFDFKTVYDNIKEKIDKGGEESLNDEERKWYDKYMVFRQRYSEIMNKRQCKNKKMSKEQFFELINKEKSGDKCPPVPVVYPTPNCASVCECVNE